MIQQYVLAHLRRIAILTLLLMTGLLLVVLFQTGNSLSNFVLSVPTVNRTSLVSDVVAFTPTHVEVAAAPTFMPTATRSRIPQPTITEGVAQSFATSVPYSGTNSHATKTEAGGTPTITPTSKRGTPTRVPSRGTTAPGTKRPGTDTTPDIAPSPIRTTLPPTATASANDVYQQLIAAKDQVRQGTLEATIDYKDGTSAFVTVHYSIEGLEREAALHRTTVYTTTRGSVAYERISIGAQTWERKAAGQWTNVPTTESVLQVIQSFFPTTPSKQKVVLSGDVEVGFLYWFDTRAWASVTVDVDRASGRAYSYHQWTDVTNLLVQYTNWNEPVIIKPPSGSS